MALDRINEMSLLAWNKFRDAVYALCTNDRIQIGLGRHARLASECHDRIYSEYERRINLAQTFDPATKKFRNVTNDEIAEFQTYLKEQAAILSQLMTDILLTVSSQFNLQIQWSIIRTNWTTLSGFVRLQRLEQNLAWLEDRLDAMLAEHVSIQSNPLTSFMKLHTDDESSSIASLSAALKMIQHDSNRTADELRAKLMAGYTNYGSSTLVGSGYLSEFGSKYYGAKKVAGYEAARKNAQEDLMQLKSVVDRVEKLRWPRKATEPIKPS
ncbi:hypothetical protein [Mycobacterium colombiense]|uniref:hypothetical protein n=1 Tax=Mycobacterium colombiense TaxID=339268 RepID=UPI00114F5E23|nr:hypothetical protein [Mycobacterium colombiense]